MITGRHGPERLGACTDCRRFWAQFRAGTVSAEEIEQIEGKLATTAGTCAVMGTATTMACIAETLGMMLPGTAAIPAVHADRLRAAEANGRRRRPAPCRAADPAEPRSSPGRPSAMRCGFLLAVGGSTNAIIHLTAIAGRAGIEIPPRLAQRTLRDHARPRGPQAYRLLLRRGFSSPPEPWAPCCGELSPLLDHDCMTVTGETLGDRLARESGWQRPCDHSGPRRTRYRTRAGWWPSFELPRPPAARS